MGPYRRMGLPFIEHRPLVMVGSPPCTPFSQLQTLNPQTEKAKQKWDEGVEHMLFVASLYRRQLKEGRVFLHEHPSHAKYWGLREIQKLAKAQGVAVYEADQCMYGLRTWGNNTAETVHARKATKFMNNSRALGR